MTSFCNIIYDVIPCHVQCALNRVVLHVYTNDVFVCLVVEFISKRYEWTSAE